MMFARALAFVQGLYYFITGVWPIVHIDSFQAVTGPKEDLWLVKTVGALLIAIGIILLTGSGRRRLVRETAMLGFGAALVLALVDLIYGLGGDISRIYVLEGVFEAMIALAWLTVWRIHELE
ncbi:MAG: hypothetical protein IBX61_07675 [Thermoleophilia bacterium]|nr:hypothetical protein [Thermoleophilia bacterium]